MAKVANSETGQPGADVVLGESVREFRRRDAERDNEREVEKQLQRRRSPVVLMRIAAGHPAKTVRLRCRLRLDLTHVICPFPRQRLSVPIVAKN